MESALSCSSASDTRSFLLFKLSEGIDKMSGTPSPAPIPPDQPYFDTTAYGNGPNDSVTDQSENAAITHHQKSTLDFAL